MYLDMKLSKSVQENFQTTAMYSSLGKYIYSYSLRYY